MKTNHTALPWKLDGLTVFALDTVGNIVTSAFTAQVNQGFNCSREEAQANAAFIVRCCNSHDALISALESIEERANYLSHMSMPAVSLTSIAEQARAALALAKGE